MEIQTVDVDLDVKGKQPLDRSDGFKSSSLGKDKFSATLPMQQ